MKVAIVGSRNLDLDISSYIPLNCTSIISGGAVSIDSIAANYAKKNGKELIEYLPDYKSFGRAAPIKRNTLIIQDADLVIAFWDGKSKGTLNSINQAKKLNKKIIVHTVKKEDSLTIATVT